jgi:hypothetical protein
VTVAPGAGGGAPACFYPDHARIEVDAIHIGTPDVADPRRAAHKKLVPTAYGLLVHEAGHAVHSRWHAPAGTPPVVGEVADLLEESRAEGRQRARRRGDRRWLRPHRHHPAHPGRHPRRRRVARRPMPTPFSSPACCFRQRSIRTPESTLEGSGSQHDFGSSPAAASPHHREADGMSAAGSPHDLADGTAPSMVARSAT